MALTTRIDSTPATTTTTTTTTDDELNEDLDETVSAEDVSDPAQTDVDDPKADDVTSRPSRRWRRHARRIAVVALVVAASTGVGLLGWTVWQERQITRAAHDAQQAAVAYAQVLTSIDSGTIDQNFNEVLNGATGNFKDMYSQASVQLRQLLLDNKASARGVVVDSAVQSATTNEVVVLLFVDQSVTNTNVPDPRIDRSRVKMTMERIDDRWRASKVELP